MEDKLQEIIDLLEVIAARLGALSDRDYNGPG